MNAKEAPGLRWKTRKSGVRVPYWFAERTADGRRAVAKGYIVKAVNLSPFAHDGLFLQLRCEQLQSEMMMWLSNRETPAPVFNGRFASLIDIYQCDPESPYHRIKPSSRKPYDHYAAKLREHIGDCRIDACDGRDIERWFKLWAGVNDLRDPEARLPRAQFMLAVLKKAVSFAIVCRLEGCAEFKAILSELRFPHKARRSHAPTADHVTSARRAAHAAGAASRALAYALQFETTLRQWDVIGEWIPLLDRRPSSIIHRGQKWIGPTWKNIDERGILRVTPSKTENTTGITQEYDLTYCPMVMEELAAIPLERRSGPLIVHERTGLPYIHATFRHGWGRDFKAAGIPKGIWNRDLRAGGQTEGSKAGAMLDDRAKVAGHTDSRTTARIYDRQTLESHRRVAMARTKRREIAS